MEGIFIFYIIFICVRGGFKVYEYLSFRVFKGEREGELGIEVLGRL